MSIKLQLFPGLSDLKNYKDYPLRPIASKYLEPSAEICMKCVKVLSFNGAKFATKMS